IVENKSQVSGDVQVEQDLITSGMPRAESLASTTVTKGPLALIESDRAHDLSAAQVMAAANQPSVFDSATSACFTISINAGPVPAVRNDPSIDASEVLAGGDPYRSTYQACSGSPAEPAADKIFQTLDDEFMLTRFPAIQEPTTADTDWLWANIQLSL